MTFSSFLAQRTYSIASAGRSRIGALKSQPWARQIASRIFSRHEASVGIRAHGTSAPVREALRAVRDDEVRVDLEPRPEAGAGRAGAVRRVEREAARLELVDREAVVRAAVLLAVAPLLERRAARRRAARARSGRRPRRAAARSRSNRPAGRRPGPGSTRPVSGSIGRPSGPRSAPSGASAWRTM